MQERRGIAAVQTYAARTGQIWRETGTGDVGIDGQIEFVSPEGLVNGRIAAVQVKAGRSFFKHRTELGWKFYPEEKHKTYWEQFPLPVVLVLHDTDVGASYWIDVRQFLRVPRREERAFIEVPEKNLLEKTDPTLLFENAGVFNEPFIPALEDVLDKLVTTTSAEGTFRLSYFDLFVHGLTKICRSIYYGMDVVCNAVEYNLESRGSEFGMGMGSTEHEFAFGFVRFLLAQNLAEVDYSDCLIDWVDREMQPHFVAPLTSRGRALVALIHREEKRLIANGSMVHGGGLRVAQEAFFKIDILSCFARFPRIREFQIASRHEKKADRGS